MSYGLRNVQDASSGYVPPKLIRPLRTGAEVSTDKRLDLDEIVG